MEEELYPGMFDPYVIEPVPPDDVPVPGRLRKDTERRVRIEIWRVMARLLNQIALTGRSLAKEIIHTYCRFHCPDDPNDRQKMLGLRTTERQCHRAIQNLQLMGFIEIYEVRIIRKNLVYLIIELTEEGKTYCRAYGWEPIESDWEILKKHHQGEKQLKHSAAVLLFAFHARVRGWKVTLVPKAAGETKPYDPDYDPDIRITKANIQMMVEVETNKVRKKVEKWLISGSAQRYAAICTLTPARRESLEKEVLQANVRCFSTDFRYLNLHLINAPLNPGDLWIKVQHPETRLPGR